ncbi:cobalamin biosynthesis protein [Kitasatospora sp. NPDC091335]|uniref:cobalamin biosynthesis protein n=1 Tax=Kitasatospora sp. NPDC091335 TaxID=3364085 RepID=UPI0037F6871F
MIGLVAAVPADGPEDAPVLRIAAPDDRHDGHRRDDRHDRDSEYERDDPGGSLPVLPRTLVAGIGASSRAERTEVLRLLTDTLAEACLARSAVARLATVAGKADHPAVRWAAEHLTGVPVDEYPAAALAGVPVPNPSAVVGAAVGTASVAEAAALASAPGGRLVVAKRRSAGATVAIARATVPGRIALLDLGPKPGPVLGPGSGSGSGSCVSGPRVRAELRSASAVVGTPAAVAAVAGVLRPDTWRIAVPDGPRAPLDASGRALDRTGTAVALASHGHTVALVTLGDGARLTVPPGPYEVHPVHLRP